MSLVDVLKSISAAFKTQITDAQELPTQNDNEDFQRPNSKPWCRMSIEFGEGLVAEKVGGPTSNRYRTPGLMTAQIFVPVGSGDLEAMTYAIAVRDAFCGVSHGTARFGVPTIRRVGTNPGNEYQVNVICPFFADQTGTS